MPQWTKNLYVLWLGCFAASISFSLVTPFLPLFLKEELNVASGVETWSGIMFSASFFTSCIMSPVWGALADKYGRKIMVIRSGIGIGTVFMLQYFVTEPWQLVALRALNGLFAGFIPASTALVATGTPEQNLGPALGMLQTAGAAGQIMGPLIGGIMAQLLGNRRTFLVASTIIFGATLVALFGVKEINPKRKDNKVEIIADLRTALGNPVLRTMLLTGVVIQASVTILQPVLSLQVAKLGHSRTASFSAGLVYSIVGIATVIGAPLWARFGEQIGYKRVLVLGLVGAGIFNIPLAFVTSILAFGAIRFVVGLSLAGISLALNAITAKSVDREFRGRAFGILNSFNQLGAVIGPLVGGVTGTTLGLESTFAVAAAILMLSSVLAQRLLPADVAFTDSSSA